MLLPEDKVELVSFLAMLFRQTRDELAPWREDATEFYRLYNSWVDKDNYPLRFKVFDPISYALIETMRPRLMRGLIFRDPIVQTHKGHPFTPDANVAAANRCANDWMLFPRSWQAINDQACEALIIGMSAGKAVFTKEKRKVPVRKPMFINNQQNGSYTESFQEIYKVNQPVWTKPDMFMVIPDVDAPNQDKMRYVHHVMFPTIEELKADAIGYENLDIVEQLPDWTQLEYSTQTTDNRLLIQDRNPDVNFNSLLNPAIFKGRRMVVETTWREWDEDGNELIKIVAICNEEVLIRNEIVSVWPWRFLIHNPLPGTVLGRSYLQPIRELQFASNDILNMQLDNMLEALTKMWLVGEEAEADLDQFVTENLNVIQVADIAQVKQIEGQDLSGSGQQMSNVLSQAIQQATGQSDFLRGANPERREVATTVMTLQQAAEARIDSVIKEWAILWLGVIPQIMIELAQEHLTDPVYIAKKPNEMTPQDPNQFHQIDMFALQGFFDFKITAAAIGIKELERQAITDFMSNLGQLLGPDTPLPLRMKLAAKLSETYDGMEDITDALNTMAQQAAAAPPPAPGQNQPAPGGQKPNPSANGNSGIPSIGSPPGGTQGAGPGGPQNGAAMAAN